LTAVITVGNEFLRDEYLAEFNQRFSVPAKQSGTAFIARRSALDFVFALRHERSVAPDNTVSYDNRVLQIEKNKWRYTLAGCKVVVYQHLNGSISLRYGPYLVGYYDATGASLETAATTRSRAEKHLPAKARQKRLAVEMTPPRKATKNVASRSGLGKSGQKAARLSHILTATTAG
jgi:hypothetical protein